MAGRGGSRRKAARWVAALLAPLLASVTVAGCSLSGTIGQHSIAYNGTMEVATDTVLVANILRARDRAPLHFSTLGAIHGAFNLVAGVGKLVENSFPLLDRERGPAIGLVVVGREVAMAAALIAAIGQLELHVQRLRRGERFLFEADEGIAHDSVSSRRSRRSERNSRTSREADS